jgi:hypothetical protein
VGLVVAFVGRAQLAVSILLLICAGGPAHAAPLRYAFVDHLSAPAPAPVPPSAAAVGVRESITPATLEGDVRFLASPELRGRRRGTDENARARAYITGRLRNAGLAALFNGAFEQPAYSDGTDTATPYATNVGAVYRAARADAGWIVLVAHYDHLGVVDGEVHPGADDNASAVALLLALGDALARARPALRRHVVLLFADAEEPPDVRTDRMGSSWFWRHVPMPADRLRLAIVLDLIGGRAPSEMEAAGLGDALFVLGAEASRPLADFVRSQPVAERVEPVLLSLAMIEATPYAPGRRFARSDYHGLREHLGRPFVFLSTGRTQTYHTPRDTPDTLDYHKLAASRAGWPCSRCVLPTRTQHCRGATSRPIHARMPAPCCGCPRALATAPALRGRCAARWRRIGERWSSCCAGGTKGRRRRPRPIACWCWHQPACRPRCGARAAGTSSSGKSPSARVAQSRGDAVDGEHDHFATALGFGPFAIGQGAEPPQHLHLDVVERIDVGVAELDRALDDGVAVHQFGVPGDLQYRLMGSRVFTFH